MDVRPLLRSILHHAEHAQMLTRGVERHYINQVVRELMELFDAIETQQRTVGPCDQCPIPGDGVALPESQSAEAAEAPETLEGPAAPQWP